ncbi:MAG: uroporphyrinogen decarboxylase family protein [Planctomycetota bacterium]|jgi:uroporphyrinogen decarboxylase
MRPRQRVLEAINHHEPDRVPIDFWAAPEVYNQLRGDLGLEDDEAVRRRFEVDLRYFNGPALRAQQRPPDKDGVVEDHWGVKRRCSTVSGARRDGSSYSWTYKHLHDSPLAAAESTALAVVAGADRLDRTAQLKPAMYLRGLEQFMADLMLRPDIAECILEHICAYYLEYNRRVFEAGDGTIDIFFMGDDMGTQMSLWLAPETYRKFFKKRLAAYCALAHKFGLKVMYHTCGNVAPLVGDFIEAGLDILQSLQPAALGDQLAKLKREYGRDLSFQGGIDIQGVLPKGTPADVAAHVRDRVEILAEGGGYIFGTAHNILPDTTTENILALIDAYHEYGRY